MSAPDASFTSYFQADRVAYLCALRRFAGHRQDEAAYLVHAEGGDRTWRRWENRERHLPEVIVHLYAVLTGQTYLEPITID